jgi:Arc/MetJ family transcription regulator
MATNLSIDDGLLEEARSLGHHRTKRETVNQALREYVDRRRQRRVIDFFGKLPADADYDYKKLRRR